MKPVPIDKFASQRRRWLGAVTAAAAGLAAWRGRGRRSATPTVKPDAQPGPVSSPDHPSTSARILVRPSPDSVKRHG